MRPVRGCLLLAGGEVHLSISPTFHEVHAIYVSRFWIYCLGPRRGPVGGEAAVRPPGRSERKRQGQRGRTGRDARGREGGRLGLVFRVLRCGRHSIAAVEGKAKVARTCVCMRFDPCASKFLRGTPLFLLWRREFGFSLLHDKAANVRGAQR